MRKQFGGRASKADLLRYGRSNNWKDNKFVNLEETSMNINFQTLPKILYKQLCEKENREPKVKIPALPFDQTVFLAPSSKTKMIWYGHSVVLMRINNLTVLIDPMLGPNASPIAPFATRRFSDNTLDLIDRFPDIDLLLMTHDHYDHLDYESIQKLRPKVKHYYVALGVGRHLMKWGIPETSIVEFDWWEQHSFETINITFTPTRHFSGRGLTDRAKSLWGGWAIKSQLEHIYFSGDSGYGNHFREVGARLGPFDFALMECGQYNENWHQIHMFPEESVQAGIEAKASVLMPVHWGGFSLAQHSWTDPILRFVEAAKQSHVKFMTPAIGQLFSIDSENTQVEWWKTTG